MFVKIFTAPWCQVCKSIVPKLEEMLKDSVTSYTVLDCSLDENLNNCAGIIALPAIRIYKFIKTPDCCTDLICIYEKQGNIMFSEVRKVIGDNNERTD